MKTRERIAAAFRDGAAAVIALAAPFGVLPGHNCLRCGEALTENELRVALYTGTCFRCRFAAPHAEGECSYPPEPPFNWELRPRNGGREPSGAVVWSHPTMLGTTWRHDRTRVLAFEGCADCGGRGAVLAGTGQNPIQCEACAFRHAEHPAIVAERELAARVSERIDAWRDRMDAEFQVRLRALMEERKLAEVTKALHEEVSAAVFKDGPPKPTTDAEAVFPAGWATVTKGGKARPGAKGKSKKKRDAQPDAKPVAPATDRRTQEAADF